MLFVQDKAAAAALVAVMAVTAVDVTAAGKGQRPVGINEASEDDNASDGEWSRGHFLCPKPRPRPIPPQESGSHVSSSPRREKYWPTAFWLANGVEARMQ